MAKSGPRELAAYHQQVLERESKKKMANAATSFDVETMAITPEIEERVNRALHSQESAVTKPAASSVSMPTPPPAPQPTAATQTEPPARKRRTRSDAGKPRPAKPEPKPGMVTLKLECTISEATDLLGYFMRTSHPELAHALVDAITKAQKASE